MILLGDKYRLRPTFESDLMTIFEDIRLEDNLEWQASVIGGLANLRESALCSDECWTVSDSREKAHLLFGVYRQHLSRLGMTWMVASNAIVADAAWMLGTAESRKFVSEFFERWPQTYCMSDERNPTHHRWLEWMGYRHHSTHEWGPYDFPFREYRRGY